MLKDQKGVTAEKDDFSEWFTQIMLKAELADYTDVSGAMVFRPAAYEIWEKIKSEVDSRFKKLGIRNCYFPLFIPEKSFRKEKEHVEGFSPEVAWVTHAGNAKLSERLAVRPTSEPIMYESYAKWIRSWRDLPLKLNQWNNVVRWEFKHPVPFLRTREFLWNEGHTAYASEKEAVAEEREIIGIYDEICREFLALPALIGRKTEREKFAGAVYSQSMEYFLPNGRAIQGPDFHHDGQNFSKAYGIKFLDEKGEERGVWQNTFAISTRMLGVMFAIHSDSKGLILPPKISPTKIVIVPILFGKNDGGVLKVAGEVAKKVGGYLDDRSGYKPGFKFNEWELKGVPLRIEIGPKDVESKTAVVVRRDTGEKEAVSLDKIKARVEGLLDEIQENLLAKAEKSLKNAVVKCDSLADVKKTVGRKKIALVALCKSRECEDDLKFETGGAKVLNISAEVVGAKTKCVMCGKKADYFGYVGKSY